MESEKTKTPIDRSDAPSAKKTPPAKHTHVPSVDKHIFSFDRVLSTKTFILSHLTLLILALAFFGGLYYVLYPERFAPAVSEYVPITKEPISLFLEITSPEDDILVNDANLVISGKTGPNASVIISNQTTDAALQSGTDGQFSKVFALTPGANTIEINAFDSEGNNKTVTKSVYYEEKTNEKQ